MPGNGTPNPQPSLPNQLGPFNFNPITFPGSGLGISGETQLILYENGGYNFNGTFYNPDMFDYDDSVGFVVVSSTGVGFTFAHAGTMQGWGDRWYEGGSATDSWTTTGTNPTIQANWADLCAGFNWQVNAAINFDINALITDIENIVKAVTTVVQIVTVVAAL